MIADISFLELVSDAASDTVDEVDGHRGGVLLVSSNHGKHVGVHELVEEVTILAKNRWEDRGTLGDSGERAVLRCELSDFLALVKVDSPGVLRSHGCDVETVSKELTLFLLDESVERWSHGVFEELDLVWFEVDNRSFSVLWDCDECLLLDSGIFFGVTLSYDEFSILYCLWKSR